MNLQSCVKEAETSFLTNYVQRRPGQYSVKESSLAAMDVFCTQTLDNKHSHRVSRREFQVVVSCDTVQDSVHVGD